MTDRADPKPRLVCVLGPTGVGKTAMALELAERFGGEIVSADSMQVYRHMDIGTAKPTREERARVPHHLLDVADPNEPFDVSRYIGLAGPLIAERWQRRRSPLFVVGGTGLYVRALLGGLIDGPGADESLREALRQEMRKGGAAVLYRRLGELDPRAAARIHPNDGVRIIRALEVLERTGRSIVDHQQSHRFGESSYEVLKIGLVRDRESLMARVDSRADAMIGAGWVDEVRGLLAMGYTASLKPMQSLGYRHILTHLAGRTDLGETIRQIQRDTRRYAKRQLTWFAGDPEIVWLAAGDTDAASARVDPFLHDPA